MELPEGRETREGSGRDGDLPSRFYGGYRWHEAITNDPRGIRFVASFNVGVAGISNLLKRAWARRCHVHAAEGSCNRSVRVTRAVPMTGMRSALA